MQKRVLTDQGGAQSSFETDPLTSTIFIILLLFLFSSV